MAEATSRTSTSGPAQAHWNGTGRVSLKDVAAAAGLSVSHASRALNDYDDVAPATRERVRQLADELGYRPSRRARMLAKTRRPTLRLAIVTVNLPPRWIDSSLYGPTISGILAVAAAEGLDLQLVTVGGTDPVGQLAQFVAEDRADGVVLLTHDAVMPEHLTPLEVFGVPHVLANRHFGHLPSAPEVNCVVPDWRAIAHDAAVRLAAFGHRTMALFSGTDRLSTSLDVAAGWQEGLEAAGIDPARAPVLPEGDDGRAAAHRLLTEGLPGSGQRPTAIVARRDDFAGGVLWAAHDLGIPIPDGLTVISTATTAISVALAPPLSGYDPHTYLLGEESARQVVRLLQSATSQTPPQRITLPFEFVARGTSGPLTRT